MKKILFTLLLIAAGSASVNAQETEQIDGQLELLLMKMEKLDSMYNHCNDFVAQHPKDEKAWRNLFEVENVMVEKLHFKDWNKGEELRKELNVVGRMKQVIPNTYTFYYCAYEGAYREEGWSSTEFFVHRNEYADLAIDNLPDDAVASDYERWVSYLIPKQDTVRLTRVLTSYYEHGLYSPEKLQYQFNELQGMEEGAVYLAPHEGDITGKLILQLVKGVHRDKILYDENFAVTKEYVGAVFKRIGLDFDNAIWEKLWSSLQSESYPRIFRHICTHSKRPIYVSATSVPWFILGEGIPKELQPHFYNEGLTLRYSPKPYDNMAVKRRNVETRYRLEYLHMSFQPEKKENPEKYFDAQNYIILLRGLLPYYKKHNQERYTWLKELLTCLYQQLDERGYDMEDFSLEKESPNYLEYETMKLNLDQE